MNNLPSLENSSFPVAIISFSYLPSLLPFVSFASSSHHSITDLKILSLPTEAVQNESSEAYRLNGESYLVVERNPHSLPITDLGYFKEVPHGWTKIEVSKQCSNVCELNLAYLKLSNREKCPLVDYIQVNIKGEDSKVLENTQPSISDQQDASTAHSIDLGFAVILFGKKLCPRSQVEKTYFSLQANEEILFQRDAEESIKLKPKTFCFPEGIKVARKSFGYRFVNMILSNDEAEKFYCNMLVFSEQFPKNEAKSLEEKHKIETVNGQLFHEKAFLIISEYSCTDQLNKVLEHLYKVYLSKSEQTFHQIISNMGKNFTLDNKLRVKYKGPHFQIDFKINTSFPMVSNNAIYSVFKFLQIPQIITVIESLLLEKTVFFVSESDSIIGFFIEAFISFLYPFKWVNIIIPFLSHEIRDFAEAPMPLICGISKSMLSIIHNKIQKGVFVFIDQNKVQMMEPSSKQLQLKHNLRTHLITRLEHYSVFDHIDVRDYLLNPDNLSLFKTREAEDPHFEPLKIRNILFELMVFILRDYNQFFTVEIPLNKQNPPTRISLRKCYDTKKLKSIHKKDQFLQEYFDTSLFSVLIETKLNTPEDKWIKTLDKAIKKIAKFKKQFIQEESDNNQTEGEEEGNSEPIFPKGCLNLITMISKQSIEDKTPQSSPEIKRKSISQDKKTEGSESHEKFSNRASNESKASEKSEKQTSIGNRLSQEDIPELKEMENKVTYAEDEENQPQNIGMARYLCRFFSCPVIKVQTVAGKWRKKQLDAFNEWRRRDKEKKVVKNEVMKEEEKMAEK